MNKYLIAIFIWMAVSAGAYYYQNYYYIDFENLGIIKLPGWNHGIGLCERKMSPGSQQDEAIIWNDGMATYTVNLGHQEDPEAEFLVARAHKVCAQFYE